MSSQILSSDWSKPSFFARNEAHSSFQIWQRLKIVNVEVNTSSLNTDNPIMISRSSDIISFEAETKKDLNSIKIIQPVGLSITAICDDLSTLENIIKDFNDLTTTFEISTKSIIANSLAMVSLEIEQGSDMVSASRVRMSFEQVQLPSFENYWPEQMADASVYGVSIQAPTTISLDGSSLLQALKNFQVPSLIKIPANALIDSEGGPFILDISKLAAGIGLG